MLTSIRRNNMALSIGSPSRDSMLDFFDEKADTTVNTVESVTSSGPMDTTTHQLVNDTEILSKMNTGTSGRQHTDISFQSIEEVIELASDNNGTPDISNVGPVGLRSGRSEAEDLGGKINTSEMHSRNFQSSEHGNVAPEKDDSLRDGRISVLSQLSNISLSENEPDQIYDKSGTADSDPNICSRPEVSPAPNNQDTVDMLHTVVDNNDSISQNPTLVLEDEVSFSWLKSETMNQTSPQQIPVRKSSSPPTLQEANGNLDFLYKGRYKAMDVRSDKSIISRPDSIQEFSWPKDDKDAQNQIKLSELQKDKDFSWLKSDSCVNGSESGLKLGKQNLSGTETKETVTWLTGGKEMNNVETSEITNISSLPSEAIKEQGSDPSKVMKEQDSDPNKAIEELDSDPNKAIEELDSVPNKAMKEQDSDPSKVMKEQDSDPNKAIEELDSDPSKVMKELDSDPSKAIKELDSVPNKAMKEQDSDPSKVMKEMDSDPNKAIEELDSDPNKAIKELDSDLSKVMKEQDSDPSKVIKELDSDPNKLMEELDLGWLRGEQEAVKAESISDISKESSQSATPILPTNEAVTNPGIGWLKEKENMVSTRLHSDEHSVGRSKMFTPKETTTTWQRGNDTSLESVGDKEDLQIKNNTSRDNSDQKEQTFLDQMKDLNFDFMDGETTKSNHDPVVIRDASFTTRSASSNHQADLLSVGDDDKTEGNTKQSYLTPSQSKSAGSSEVSDAIHSAVVLFHNENEESDISKSKSTLKQKRKSKRQNGSQQTNIRKKTTKTDKATKIINDESEKRDKTITKVQNSKRLGLGKSTKSRKEASELNTQSYEKGQQRRSKSHTTRGTQNDNGNSSKPVGYQQTEETSGSSDGFLSTMASSDTVIKINDVSSHSLTYEDDFEEDTRSVRSVRSSKSDLDSDSRKKYKHSLAYSSTPYGSVYAAFARQPKQPIRNENVRFPKINALKPVQLTSGQSSFSEQSFSTVAKRKRSIKKNEMYTEDSYDYKASSEPDTKPEIIFRKAGKVPVSLKAEAVYRKGRLEISVVDDRQTLSEGHNMDVRITVLHKQLNNFQFTRNRPRKLPKLNFATNRDILNHRAAYPPFNTHTDQQASERFKQAFGS